MNEWVYIDKFDFSKDYPYIHCDTRDFHVIGTEGAKFIECPYKDNVYTKEEVKEVLKQLEEFSGGKGEWRFITWRENGTHPGWWKYIRFKKIDDNKYLGYSEEGGYLYPFKKSMKPNLISKEHLNFCKED